MLTENVLPDFDIERRNKIAFYLILLLFLLATIINCIFYAFPNLLKYPLKFHLTSFNSYFSVVVRIVLPVAGMAGFYQKKKDGWTTLTFLTIFGIAHIIFWAARLFIVGVSLLLILQQLMVVILVLLIPVLYFLLKTETLERYKITGRDKMYTLLAGLVLAILFTLKIFTIG